MMLYENNPILITEGLTTFKNEDGLDYVAATQLTASNVSNYTHVGIIELTAALAAVIHAAEQMDLFKKALFRQRTREQSGLSPELDPIDISVYEGLTKGLAESDHAARVASLDSLFHGIIGMITETGELAEVLMGMLVVNTEPDVTNVREEIGDNLWYAAQLVLWADTTFLTEMRRNIDKLRARHGASGFDKDRDINRDLDAERELLEGADTTRRVKP